MTLTDERGYSLHLNPTDEQPELLDVSTQEVGTDDWVTTQIDRQKAIKVVEYLRTHFKL